MKLRELIENSDPDVDFDQFCMDNIGALFTAAIDGDSDDLATIAPVDRRSQKQRSPDRLVSNRRPRDPA